MLKRAILWTLVIFLTAGCRLAGYSLTVDYRPPGVVGEGSTFLLYFLSPEGWLVPVTRTVPATKALVWAALDGLNRGPESGSGLSRPSPYELRKVMYRNGVAFLDIALPTAANPPSGTWKDLLTATLAQFTELRSFRVSPEGGAAVPADLAMAVDLDTWRSRIHLWRPATIGQRTYLAMQPLSDSATSAAAGDAVALFRAIFVSGPGAQLMAATFPPGTKIVDCRVSGRDFTLDLSREFVDNFRGNEAGARLLVDLLVMTITELPGVERVRITVNGSPIGNRPPFDVPEWITRPTWVNPESKPAAGGTGTVDFLAVGDVMTGRRIQRRIAEHGLDYPLAKVNQLMASADLTFANLEAALSTSGTRLPPKKGIWLRGTPESVGVLTRAGIDVVSLANNHILDYDSPSLLQTFDVLAEHGINYCGAGENITTARAPAWVEIKGLKLGFLAYNAMAEIFWDWDYRRSFEATETLPGNPMLRERDILHDLSLAVPRGDHIFVSLHWGVEGSHEVSVDPHTGYDQRQLAYRLIDAGAASILGQHPHVLQGVEIYRGAIIAYSMGNFLYDQDSTRFRDTMVLRMDVTREGIRNPRIYVGEIIEDQPTVLTGAAAQPLLRKMQSWSRALDTDWIIIDNYLTIR
ncbi:MAG: CapA family protein [Bacillota bacterium]